MKERGILFADAMVRAILAGKKTQTRRAVRVPKVCPDCIAASTPHPNGDGGSGLFGSAPYLRVRACDHLAGESVLGDRVSCPYGATGSRLWVRECHTAFEFGHVLYRADFERDPDGERAAGIRWTPSLLMPRWASRITLEITGIRVERAQSISDADVDAEGVDAEAVQSLWDDPKNRRRWGQVQLSGRFPGFAGRSRRELWSAGWTLINGRESWDANPWVWVIDFRRAP